MKVTIPMIHLNGSGKKLLLDEGYAKALEAFRSAAQTLNSVQLHSRDYYPLGEDAFDEAFKERLELHRKLREVREYLEELVDGIEEQTGKY